MLFSASIFTLLALANISQAVVVIPRTSVEVSATSTVCACISGTIKLGTTDCGSIPASNELCTCISVLADVVATSTLSPLKTALTIGSKADLILSLTGKINGCGSSDKKTCTHPEYSVPSCSRTDLCGFTCKSGYTRSGDKCVKTTTTSTLAAVSTVPAVSTGSTVCACISGTIKVGGKDCGSIAASSELCTCISALADAVATCTLTPIKTALTIGSTADVVLSLTDKINSCGTSDKKTCTHPDYSVPSCSRKDLCGFTCKSGYTRSGDKCVKNTTTSAPATVSTVPAVSTGSTVCACISGTIKLGTKDCGSISASDELCTCISVLADIIATSTLSPIKTALTIGSTADVVLSLTGKINSCGSADKKTCTHPEYSVPSCSRKDLCGFTCKSGYTRSGDKCVKTTTTSTPAAISTVPAVSTGSTVCACISGTIKVGSKDCGSIAASSELCTCISVLATVVDTCTLSPIKTALTIGSKADVILSLTDKINSCGTSDKKTCTHPEYSVPSCSRTDLCGFTCQSGYSRSGDKCVKTTTVSTVDVSSTVCACISGSISVGSRTCGSISTSDALCTCISVLADVLVTTTLLPLKTALTIATKADVVLSLTNKINSYGSSDKKTCTHPKNSTPSCSKQDLCGYTCKSGYKRSGSECVVETILDKIGGILGGLFH